MKDSVAYSETCIRMRVHVLRWASLFAILTVVSAVFGFGALSSATTRIAEVCFYVFLTMTVAALILQIARQ